MPPYAVRVKTATGWQDIALQGPPGPGGGASTPATTSALGTIQLAGDLTGTATSPQIAAGAVTDAEVAAANKDGANATPGMRTLNATPKSGSTAGQAMAASTPMSQMVPPASPGLNANGFQLYNVQDPTAAQDAATKTYVDGKAGYYSTATHAAGTTITVTRATHGLRASRGLIVQVQNDATGAVEVADIVVSSGGDVTVTFAASATANSKRVTICG
jgi:hypothetical protein